MKIKNNKAITLIALIITIVILLILAGVTIATLTGENGILNQTETAKVKNEKEEVVEKIKMALMISRTNINNIAEIDTTILENELKKELGEDITIYKNGDNEFLPWYVVKNDYGYDILEDTTVNAKEGAAILKVTSITVDNLIAIPGSTAQLNIKTVPEHNIENLTFKSSDSKIATVDETGKVTILETATGGAKVTITVAGEESTDVKGTCTITVKDIMSSINIEDIQIEVGEIKRLKLNTVPELGTNTEELQFSQSEESKSIATVEENGDVTGLAKGTVDITAKGKISGIKYTCKVTVVDATSQSTLVSQIQPSDYGKEIDYIATVNGTQVSNWKVFYNDGSNVYLILDDLLNTSLLPKSSVQMSFQANGSSNKYVVNFSEWGDNFVGGLSKSSDWKEFANGVNNASAIGSPTLTMWQNSYNETRSESINDNLYVIAEAYWLASKSDMGRSYVYCILSNGSVNYAKCNNSKGSIGIRPVVCLPGDLTGTVGETVKIKRTYSQAE